MISLTSSQRLTRRDMRAFHIKTHSYFIPQMKLTKHDWEIVDVEFNNGLKKQAQKTRFMLIETPTFMHELASNALKRGAVFVPHHFANSNDVISLSEDIIFNCSGLWVKRDFWRHEFDPDPRQLVYAKKTPDTDYFAGGRCREGDKPICHHLSLPRQMDHRGSYEKGVDIPFDNARDHNPDPRERKASFRNRLNEAPRRTLVLFRHHVEAG